MVDTTTDHTVVRAQSFYMQWSIMESARRRKMFIHIYKFMIFLNMPPLPEKPNKLYMYIQ